MIDKLISWLAACIEIGFRFVASHIMTFEGMIALMLGLFFLGLVNHIRS